jgi:hypothetical protein
MGVKKHRLTVGLDRDDVSFLQDTKVFKSTADGIRFSIKFLRLYGLPAIREIKKEK